MPVNNMDKRLVCSSKNFEAYQTQDKNLIIVNRKSNTEINLSSVRETEELRELLKEITLYQLQQKHLKKANYVLTHIQLGKTKIFNPVYGQYFSVLKLDNYFGLVRHEDGVEVSLDIELIYKWLKSFKKKANNDLPKINGEF